MIIREYQTEDLEAILDLFYETVHTINAKDYSKEQLDAWTSGISDKEKWNKSLCQHYSLIAEIGNQVVGFGDIDDTGYLDRLYVHKDFQRQGIASNLCDELEKNYSRIITHASISAKGFFEKRGYRVIKEQIVIRNGISLKNYVMEKIK